MPSIKIRIKDEETMEWNRLKKMENGVLDVLGMAGIVVGCIIVVAAIVMFVLTLQAFPLMLLWNLLMPSLLSAGSTAASITFLEACMIVIICNILFGSTTSSSKK